MGASYIGPNQNQKFIPQQNNLNTKQGCYLTKQQITLYQKQSNQTKIQLKQCKEQNQKLNKKNTQLQQKSNYQNSQNKQLQKIIQFIYKGQQHIHSQNQQIYKQKQQICKQKQQQNRQLKQQNKQLNAKLKQVQNLLQQYRKKQTIKLLQQKLKNQKILKQNKKKQLLKSQNRYQTSSQQSQRQQQQQIQSEYYQTRTFIQSKTPKKPITLYKPNSKQNHHHTQSNNNKILNKNNKQQSNLSQNSYQQSQINNPFKQNSKQNSQILKNDNFHIHSLKNSIGKIYKIKKSSSNQNPCSTWASAFIIHNNKLMTIAGFFYQQGQPISMDKYEIRFYPYLLQQNLSQTNYIKVKDYKVLQQFQNSSSRYSHQQKKLKKKFDISTVQLQPNDIIKQQHCLKLFQLQIPDLFCLYAVCYVPIQEKIQRSKRQLQLYKGMQLKVLQVQIKQIQVSDNKIMKQIKKQDLNEYLYDDRYNIVFNFDIKSKSYKKIKYIKGTPLLIKYKKQYHLIGINVLPKINQKNISIILNNNIINKLLN